MITLYGAKNSGHSYKVRLFLIMAHINHHYQAIDLSLERGQRHATFDALAPYGEVPLLVENGSAMAQSNAILLHLARHYGHFGAGDEAGWTSLTTWLFWEANRIGRSYPNMRYYRVFDTTAAADLVAWFEATSIADLDRLNAELSKAPFLNGTFSIADIACAAYLLYGDDFGFPLARWPHIIGWLERIRALPGFMPPQTAMA